MKEKDIEQKGRATQNDGNVANEEDQVNSQKDKQSDISDKEAEISNKDESGESENKIESMGIKLQEVNDKYLRLYSEFENYRKRTSKEKIDLISNASEEVIKDILPVIDDFDRALEQMAKIEDQQVKQNLEGVNLIYKKLYSILERRGLKPINAKGSQFNEDLHEAIAQIPAPSEEEKGKVIDETTKGYYLNDKVIRFSKVVVAI
ncbi:MAG: nucleotide exchange factor GrpE [Bacteroidales bacterium]|nr:nucleotide exchange factor GrpE [Bacteroidales bacterium]